jgi:DNA-directed RNA polymerase subunit N (RpoN/RPB10)
MLIPVVCVNCGGLLGNKYDWFQKELQKRKGPGFMEPLCFDGSKPITTIEAQLFKELYLTRYCCRKTLLTHVDLIGKV